MNCLKVLLTIRDYPRFPQPKIQLYCISLNAPNLLRHFIKKFPDHLSGNAHMIMSSIVLGLLTGKFRIISHNEM